MDKKDYTAAVAMGVTAIVLGTVAFFAIKHLRKKRYTSLKQISRFIANPEKLGSPDEKDSWKKVSQELLYKLEQISKKLGRKLTINSGYRSESHNKKVGGKTKSAHKTGEAVDIAIPNYLEGVKIGRVAKDVGVKRMGITNSFIHIDVSKTLPQVRFAYDNTGISADKINKDLGFA